MTTNQNIESKIIELLDGELSAEDAQQLMQIIAQNDAYKMLLEEYKKAYSFQNKEEENITFSKKEQLLKPPSTLHLGWMSGIAAALALVLSFIVFQSEKNKNATPIEAEKVIVHNADKDSQSTYKTPTEEVKNNNTPQQKPAHQKSKNLAHRSSPQSQIPLIQEQNPEERLHTIDKLQPTTTKPRLDYNQQINTAFVAKLANTPNPEDELAITEKIGLVSVSTLMPNFSEIKESVQHYGDKFFEHLAVLNDKYKRVTD